MRKFIDFKLFAYMCVKRANYVLAGNAMKCPLRLPSANRNTLKVFGVEVRTLTVFIAYTW